MEFSACLNSADHENSGCGERGRPARIARRGIHAYLPDLSLDVMQVGISRSFDRLNDP